jgi:hypothetical protein
MGWEARRGSAQKYYTRSRKRCGRVEREYVGCGPLALSEANLDDLRRRDLAEARELRRRTEHRLLKENCDLDAVMVELIVKEQEILDIIGFRIHRGQWRLKRVLTQQAMTIWDKVRAAGSGDPVAVRQVREELQGPNRDLLLDQAGDLARQCERKAFAILAPDQKGYELVIREKMNDLRLELAPTNPIETLIVERIVQCWLQLHSSETQAMSLTPPNKALESRVDSLNRRYMHALKTLATVRRCSLRVTKQVTTTVELEN